MDTPRVAGIKQGTQIGTGGCGRVFHATDADGKDLAVKFFTPSAVAIALLEKMTQRLESGGWPEGVMPVISADFRSAQPFWVTPLMGEFRDGTVVSTSLQMVLAEHPGTESWKAVKGIARALAAMHARRVAHGNLKPGNVFLTDDGRLLLADWTLGNMPGIQQFPFTDAVLYQSPEQLRRPEGYVNEEGYRWDVFAFGVLAFRLLTGRFPRCHDTFHFVAPASGVTHKGGIRADLQKLAHNLDAQPGFTWPDPPANSLEAGFREWIDRCLPLDPTQRPASMVEVAEGFAKLERKAAADVERETMLDQRRRTERRSWRTIFFAGMATTAAVVLGALWHLAKTQIEQERVESRAEMVGLESEAMTAVSKKEQAREELVTVRRDLSSQRDLAVVRLEASQRVGDRLFAWAMEEGNRSLPPLDGREQRLKMLERYYEDFLISSAEVAELAAERARARLALAEISISAGDAEASSTRLSGALADWEDLPLNGELKLRVATDRLLLALLRQSRNDAGTEAAFVTARKALEDVPQAEVDTNRLNQLLAMLDLHEAKWWSAKGDNARALEQLKRAAQMLNRISDQRPDAAIVRSELAASYLSSATILEGMGSVGDAREVRALAAKELVKLLEKQPQDFALRLDLAGTYAAMAESALISGDITGAETISKAAMKLLDQLVVEQPDNARAVSRKASQLGLRAGILRDRGQAEEAMKDYDAGIDMLVALRESSPTDALVAYRLALLWWQKGRMLGMSGSRDQEIDFLIKAKDLMGQLGATPSANGPRPDQIQSASAYLMGDLGHALQLDNRKDDAVQAFTVAVALWEKLVASRPQSEEYTEGLAWCRQRLADLQ